MTKTEKDVNDGFSYFNSGILEELTTDKKYYVKAFMDYIQELESKLNNIQDIDNTTNEIMDQIRDIFDEIDLTHYINNNTDYDIDDLDDRFYTIIHNKLKQIK